jgi:hypothetical protein
MRRTALMMGMLLVCACHRDPSVELVGRGIVVPLQFPTTRDSLWVRSIDGVPFNLYVTPTQLVWSGPMSNADSGVVWWHGEQWRIRPSLADSERWK